VHGVFFRASCAEEARRRGVAGYVRNMPDGAVEAAFEGTDDDVRAMVEWCATGPPTASVDAVTPAAEDPVGDTTFRIG
jgi:acylphosphatase